MKYKYHYVFYKADSYLGDWQQIGTAQDKSMFKIKKYYLLYVAPSCQFTYKKERISVEDWKARYC